MCWGRRLPVRPTHTCLGKFLPGYVAPGKGDKFMLLSLCAPVVVASPREPNLLRRSLLATASSSLLVAHTHTHGDSSRQGSRRPSATAVTSRLAAARSLSVPLRDLGVPSQSGPLRYPEWLLGSWRLHNAIKAFSMPLGSAFADGFTQYSARSDQGLCFNVGTPLEHPALTPLSAHC
jgi:hypothetical protein